MEEQNVTIAPKTLHVPSTVKGLIEAMVFAADEPLTIKQIKAIYDNNGLEGEPRSIEPAEIQEIIVELNQEYQEAERGYRIIQIAGGYQFATLTEYAGWLGKLYREQARRKLSQSSLETLAIVAYKQPVSKPEIESIRGVNCDYVLRTLLEKELVAVVGRAETVGRPLLYGTTREFLKHFGLNDVTDLPRPREIEEILGESQFETERRMLEAQSGIEKMKKGEDDFKSRLPHIPKKKPELDEPVQIISRKRSRQINIRRSETEEERSQEGFQFDSRKVVIDSSPGPVEEEPAKGSQSFADSPASEARIQKPYELIEPPRKPEPIQTLHEELPEAMQQEKWELPGTDVNPSMPEGEVFVPLEPAKSLGIARAEQETPPKNQTQTRRTEPPSQAASRWNVWKHRIQTFIKKLFG